MKTVNNSNGYEFIRGRSWAKNEKGQTGFYLVLSRKTDLTAPKGRNNPNGFLTNPFYFFPFFSKRLRISSVNSG